MCRLLYVRSGVEVDVADHLGPFAELSRQSPEYQGHGWGCAFLRDGDWKCYHSIQPIWEDDLQQFGQSQLLLAHSRSAFEDRDIRVENNMPFFDGDRVFIFNGELRKVKIKSPGRIGAEKIFNFIKRFDRGDLLAAMQRAIPIINQRTTQVKAMNILIADKQDAFLATQYSERPGYFTMYEKQESNRHIICSMPYPGETDWQPIDQPQIRACG
ncbi:MAG: hypothetical protein AAGF97_08050 [Planctomycetota bacterium]